MGAVFIQLTDPTGGKLALNAAHMIAITPVVPSAWQVENAPFYTRVLTTVGIAGEGTNWQHWDVRETFDDVLALIAKATEI